MTTRQLASPRNLRRVRDDDECNQPYHFDTKEELIQMLEEAWESMREGKGIPAAEVFGKYGL